MTEYDPHSRFEDEGIPDMQDGTPQQQWAVDPQEAPLPGDRPMAVDDFGTTVEEEIQGESLEGRLRREIPEEQPAFGVDPAEQTAGGEEPAGGGTATWTGEDAKADAAEQPEIDTGYDAADAAASWPGQPEEPSGTVWDDPRPAGRLVDQDQGLGPDNEPDLIAEEVGPDRGGFTAEEAAMRVEPE